MGTVLLVATPALVCTNVAVAPDIVVVVEPIMTKVPVVVVDAAVPVVEADAVPGDTGRMVPVQAEPRGQQAAWLAPSTEQRAVVGQQTLGAAMVEQA